MGVVAAPETGIPPSHFTQWMLLVCSLLYLTATVLRDASNQVPGVDVVNLTIALTVVVLAVGLLLGVGGHASAPRSKVKSA